MDDPEWKLVETCVGDMARVQKKAYHLIVRFVPCHSHFNPSRKDNIAAVKEENGLPVGPITRARWLKKVENRIQTQTLALLKVNCNSVEVANHLLWECIFIAGHLVAIREDLRELLHCNECQHYGHFRVTCRNTNHCGQCMSKEHVMADCPSGSQSCCVTCGPDSTHVSSSCKCPAFLKHCEDLDMCYLENKMPYFLTRDPQMWLLSLAKKSYAPLVPTPWVPADQSMNLGMRQVSILNLLKPDPRHKPAASPQSNATITENLQ
ncbi:hypothetical protein J132_08091 [Termitomyces sp. J132]|nr:hypothetical protein J132_08091 [Termitomyces sp. J132]